jgi:TPR repeat protein
MRLARNLFLMTGLLWGLHGLSAAPASAQSGGCADLMSAQQKVKCVRANGSFADLEQMLKVALPQATAEDLRLVIEGLEYDRLQGDVTAMLGLGAIYENGIAAIPQDLSKAAGHYLDAAAVGSTDGMLRVAMLYCDGRIAAPDLECLYFLRNAAEFGQTDALLMLAEQLVEKTDDFEGAKTYLEKAIRLGVPGAEDALKQLVQSRT